MAKKIRSVAVLASGGLDSAVLIDFFLKKQYMVTPLYIAAGHRWEAAELYWLRKFLTKIRGHRKLKPVAVLSLPTHDLYPNHWSIRGKKVPGARTPDRAVYIPGKNLLLIAKASVFCALRKIPLLAFGPLKLNPFPDATPEFLRVMERACSEGMGRKFKVIAPFRFINKRDVMKKGKHLPLVLTFSCLSPVRTKNSNRRYLHCGKCGKCAERKKAFREARLKDLTSYAR